MNTRILVFLALLPSALGCSSHLQQGVREYQHARYPEALIALDRAEPELNSSDDIARARHALYSGLVHLATGRATSAVRWLSQARQLERRRPGALTGAERGQLEAAWRSIGLMPGERAAVTPK